MAITIKSEREIELMAEAGKILERVHNELENALRPGMSTKDIDTLGEEIIRSYGCIPSFLNYNGYPASICVSVNQEVVHGIPDKHRIIHEGDIVSLDAGLIYKGYHSDAARTHAVGEVSEEAKKLIQVTKECFFEGIKYAKAGNHLFDISGAIGRYAEENRKCRGEGKPETFTFLGLTHYCSHSKSGNFRVKRKTSKKKFAKKCKEVHRLISSIRHWTLRLIITKLNQILVGYYHYYGITDNFRAIDSFYYKVRCSLFYWLNRRSQKISYTWKAFNDMLKVYPLTKPRIYVSIYGT